MPDLEKLLNPSQMIAAEVAGIGLTFSFQPPFLVISPCQSVQRPIPEQIIIVGGVFLSQGIQKFLFPGDLGVGRFVKTGIPSSQVMAPFVGVVEIVGGVLLLAGFLTRLAAVPHIINMLVAITTKIPILQKSGRWAMAHEARIDYAMLLGCISSSSWGQERGRSMPG
jgi:putative oxidoreductase